MKGANFMAIIQKPSVKAYWMGPLDGHWTFLFSTATSFRMKLSQLNHISLYDFLVFEFPKNSLARRSTTVSLEATPEKTLRTPIAFCKNAVMSVGLTLLNEPGKPPAFLIWAEIGGPQNPPLTVQCAPVQKRIPGHRRGRGRPKPVGCYFYIIVNFSKTFFFCT